MELIRCTQQHIDAVVSLYHEVIAYLESHINYPKWSSEHPSDQGVADAAERGELYACLRDGVIVGAAIFNEDPEGDYDAGEWSRKLKPEEVLVVHALAVHPDHAGCGIGSFMVTQCIALARRSGYQAIRLDVVPGNIPAERLYRSKGFTYVGTKDLRRQIEAIPVFDLYELNL